MKAQTMSDRRWAFPEVQEFASRVNATQEF
jgi:hypothetical protein